MYVLIFTNLFMYTRSLDIRQEISESTTTKALGP